MSGNRDARCPGGQETEDVRKPGAQEIGMLGDREGRRAGEGKGGMKNHNRSIRDL